MIRNSSVSTTAAKFAILTNGIIYRFYTDLENTNKMDEDPFLAINILDIRDHQVPELKKFCKSVFDVDSIFSTASELKYVHEFKDVLTTQLNDPTDDFVRIFLQGCYSGQKTQSVIERFRPVLRKALSDFISETMNDKLKIALGGAGGSVSIPDVKLQEEPTADADDVPQNDKRTPIIVTTEEELEAYFIIKNLLSEAADMKDITYKDTESYINVLYKANTRKWICRIKLTDSSKTLIIPDENKKEVKYQLQDIYDIKQYKDTLIEVLTRYL